MAVLSARIVRNKFHEDFTLLRDFHSIFFSRFSHATLRFLCRRVDGCLYCHPLIAFLMTEHLFWAMVIHLKEE